LPCFLDREDQYYWMLELDGRVVGAIWVDLVAAHHLLASSISIMIGDPEARVKAVGSMAVRAVAQYLRHLEFERLYSRHLVENEASGSMLSKLGFALDGAPYVADDDGLEWQNRVSG
jgi:RimJ/RimL family protein N-acetyltransferase